VSSDLCCVIATHGRPSFLAEALTSVAAQTCRPDRVVVVSDVPDDEARRVCADAAGRSGLRVDYLQGVRAGASASRNLGARSAGNSLLAFLDDDDLWEPHYLATVVDRARAQPSVALWVTWLNIFTGDAVMPGPAMPPGLAARQACARNWGSTGSNVVVRSSAFHAIGGFDEDLPVQNDTDFVFRLLASGAEYGVVPQRLVWQRKHADGQLTDKSEIRARGIETYLRKHRAALSLSGRRALLFKIHRIRRNAAPSWAPRTRHLAAALWFYSPAQFVEDVRWRRRVARSRATAHQVPRHHP
jgi:GT2 family glycosyltransferase